MCLPEVRSDQLYKWSDENRKRTCYQPEKAPRCAFAPATAAQGSPARLADRAVQALRQARVQVRRRSRPWPQVLSSVSRSGLRPQMDYVPQESHAQVAEFIANYHRAREILEAISEINRELLRRREAL